VFVKPNSKSRGIGVAKVFTRAEFYQAMRQAFSHDDVAIVETAVIDASDYRIVVLDNHVISAYERIPLSVTGDGRSSIRRLLVNKQKEFERLGRDSRLNLRDARLITKLVRLKLDLKSRLEKGRQIFLLDNANLSSGGESRDVTSIVHPDFRRLAIRVTKGMGLRLCGVDLLVKDGSLADPAKKFYVLEINSAPGLDHYAKSGEEQRRIVERLYLAVIKAMER
jgi:D-alanine-D-alanine ligase-like ATP-grasp enzyme